MNIDNQHQDNCRQITIQKFNNLFVSAMNGILQNLYDLPGIYFFVANVAISFVLHIMFLMKEFDNRVRNKKLLGIIQSSV